MTLELTAEEDESSIAATDEEAKVDEEEEEAEFVYDRALFDADGLEEEEDVDFDD